MALGTTLPFWPALVFTYLEPIALVGGFRSAALTPTTFVSSQLPSTFLSHTTPIPASATILAYTIGNIFLLLAAIAIICTAITREPRVTKAYLFAVALADLGHIYSSYVVMGPDVFWNFNHYNDMMWGNIGVSVFLHVNRVATLLGLFGRVGRRS